MEKSKLKVAMREMREGETQQQMAMDLHVSREAVSKYENNERQIPPDISRKMMERKDSPRFALAMRHEYTRTGPVWLDGSNVDLHHASVKEKTLEEIGEAMTALREFNFARSLQNISHWERPEAEKVIEESIEAITALEHLVVIMCEKLNISSLDAWSNHYTQLRAKGWLS